jgi:hypothetical protein
MRHCPNIGPAGIARRRKTGVVAGIIGGVATVALIALDAPVGAVGLTIIPFTISAVGFLQAREST